MPRLCMAHWSFNSDPTSVVVYVGTCATFIVARLICRVDCPGLIFAWISSTRLEHFDSATQVITPDSSVEFVWSRSYWLGSNSTTIRNPDNLLHWFSSLYCFSAVGRRLDKLVGSAVSAFTCSSMLATINVVVSNEASVARPTVLLLGRQRPSPPALQTAGLPSVNSRVLK